jgi:hypothetical protein
MHLEMLRPIDLLIAPDVLYAGLGADALYFARGSCPRAFCAGQLTAVDTEGCCLARCGYTLHPGFPVQCGIGAGPMPDGTMRCAAHARYWWVNHTRAEAEL